MLENFQFTIDESKSVKENIDGFRSAVQGFLKTNAVSVGDYNKVKTELEASTKSLGEFKTKETSSLIESIAKDVSPDNWEKVKKYTKFADDFDLSNKDEIKKMLTSTNDDLFPVNEQDNPILSEKSQKDKSLNKKEIETDKYSNL